MSASVLDSCDATLRLIDAALRQTHFRNEYESENAFAANMERLKDVRGSLATFSGSRVEAMLHRCDDLERDWNKKLHSLPHATKSDAGAFGGEWIQSMQAEDEIDEMEELTETTTQKRKAKSKGKRMKGAAGVDLTDGHGNQRDKKNEKIGLVRDTGMARGSSLVYLMHPNSAMDLDEQVLDDVDTMKPGRKGGVALYEQQHQLPRKHVAGSGAKAAEGGEGSSSEGDSSPLLPVGDTPSSRKTTATLETHELSLTSAIPPAVVADCRLCPVVPIEGTAFAEVRFPTVIDSVAFEGKRVVYHIQMFRAVIAAVANRNLSSTDEGTAKVGGKDVGRSPATAKPPVFASPSDSTCPAQDADVAEDCVLLSDESGSDDDAESRNQRVWRKMGSQEFEVLQDLSTALVAEFDQKEEEVENLATDGKGLPNVLVAPLEYLRFVSTSTWVILLCHGGYFAGAVYSNTKPILHKSFHRYVVRKKQGGKQSSHDKAGGSGGSAGGQIRRGQEIKWRAAVRDLLIAWRAEIDKAWVILYAAPGPDNRAMLTDFSLLPASTSSGAREKSPIDMKDPRVRSVPLTTHRPTFNEVQRVYDSVSRCTIRIKEAEDSVIESA